MIIPNVLKQILTYYRDILQHFNIQASFSCWQRVSQIELCVTTPPPPPSNWIIWHPA